MVVVRIGEVAPAERDVLKDLEARRQVHAAEARPLRRKASPQHHEQDAEDCFDNGLLREVAFLQARRETVSRIVDASRAAIRFALPTGTEPHRRPAARASLANTLGLQGGSLDSVLKNAGAWVARMPDATPVVDQGITTTSALQTTAPSRR